MIKKQLIFLALAVFLFLPKTAFADNVAAPLVAVADSSTDFHVPYAVQPNGSINFAVEYIEKSGADDTTNFCYLTTASPFIKFDLSTYTAPITSASLSLTLAHDTDLASLPIGIASAEDGWEESNLRYSSRILAAENTFAGMAVEVDGRTVTFRSLDGTFAQWLEAQRLSDGIATVTLKSIGMVGCVPAPISPSENIDLTFEDRTNSEFAPTLSLNGDDEVSRLVPTAVTLSNAATNQNKQVRSIIFIAVTGLIMMTSVVVFFHLAVQLNSAEPTEFWLEKPKVVMPWQRRNQKIMSSIDSVESADYNGLNSIENASIETSS